MLGGLLHVNVPLDVGKMRYLPELSTKVLIKVGLE